MGNGKCGQMGIMVNTEDRDGAPWGMGHMGDGAHGQWDTWPMGHMDNGTHEQWDMGRGVSWLILKIEMGHLGGWGTWAMGHMVNMCVWSCAGSCETSLILHGFSPNFY